MRLCLAKEKGKKMAYYAAAVRSARTAGGGWVSGAFPFLSIGSEEHPRSRAHLFSWAPTYAADLSRSIPNDAIIDKKFQRYVALNAGPVPISLSLSLSLPPPSTSRHPAPIRLGHARNCSSESSVKSAAGKIPQP
jgi:hypothetical protein